MADYLDARVRYRSESVNTEVSSTLPSSSPLATPFINAKPTPLLSTNCPTNTILKSHGRPPWYGQDGQSLSPAFVVAIAGGSSSGKTHVARQIVRSLGSIPTVVIISQDSFYKKHTPEEVALAFASRFDLDHPDSIDMDLFASVSAVVLYEDSRVLVHEHQRLDETKYLYGATIIIGMVWSLIDKPLLQSLFSRGFRADRLRQPLIVVLQIFVQADSDLMLARRITRDTKERGRSVDGILEQYLRYVKPSYDNFVLPSARHADIIVPGKNNAVAIELICTHIGRELERRSRHFRQEMVGSLSVEPSLSRGPAREPSTEEIGLTVLEQTPQLKSIYTILRDRTSTRQDFIFFTDRLATLLVEKAMEKLPYREVVIETPVGVQSKGKTIDAELVFKHIHFSGGPLELGLQRVINDVAIGSLLVQSDSKTGDPLLFQVRLPNCIRERHSAVNTWVFLLDAQIGTGAAGFMAIRVLLDHGVKPAHIIFVTFLVARSGGVVHLRRTFPEVNIVTGAVDDGLHEVWVENAQRHAAYPDEDGFDNAQQHKAWVVEPGMGQIGDRYYLN
ncbi:armadillo/beta-catenin/plakoglobin [Russula aff. rugulosa BPL654]|nr:armadillo/beta-catenin/plakoglobin [Russula aff. rugulosa BPL654]